jgi:hypothetical protein
MSFRVEVSYDGLEATITTTSDNPLHLDLVTAAIRVLLVDMRADFFALENVEDGELSHREAMERDYLLLGNGQLQRVFDEPNDEDGETA